MRDYLALAVAAVKYAVFVLGLYAIGLHGPLLSVIAMAALVGLFALTMLSRN